VRITDSPFLNCGLNGQPITMVCSTCYLNPGYVSPLLCISYQRPFNKNVQLRPCAGDGHRNCCPRRVPVKEEVILKCVKQSEAGRDAMGVQCEPGGKKTRTDFRWSRLNDGDETQRKKSAQTVDKGAEILVTPRMEVPCSFIVHTRARIGLGTAKTGKRSLSYSGAC
jgi:hypothetical protein